MQSNQTTLNKACTSVWIVALRVNPPPFLVCTKPSSPLGRQLKALQYCQALNDTGDLFYHMEWQLCCADVAEVCKELLICCCVGGSTCMVVWMEVYSWTL